VVRSVRVGVCEMSFAPLIYVMPSSPLEGKFSMHYCVASALLRGELGLGSFTAERIADPAVRALIPKVTVEIDEDLRHDSEFPARLTVFTESGARHEKLVPLAMGKPNRWFSVERMQAKFRDCAGLVLGKDADRAFAALRELDGALPLDTLFERLQPVA
jgi:2-methylcitrate dehydratase PrpD